MLAPLPRGVSTEAGTILAGSLNLDALAFAIAPGVYDPATTGGTMIDAIRDARIDMPLWRFVMLWCLTSFVWGLLSAALDSLRRWWKYR